MRYTIGTRNDPCTLVLKVRALKPMTIRIQAYDTRQKNTFLTDRTATLAKDVEETFDIQMPLSPGVTGLTIYDDDKGDSQATNNFEVVSIKKKGLRRHMDVSGLEGSKVRSFVRFAQRFCFNAGWLPVNVQGETYTSDNNQFKIRYLDIITDNGREVVTPARINKFTHVIEVSKRLFVEMTVPERFCILCHEFSHLFVNLDPTNELEADLNGLTIYLALGYPRIEAIDIFLKTFYAVPTDANISRFGHIENFIKDFDNYFNNKKTAA